MEHRQTASTFGVEGRIDTRVHDEEDLREAADGDYDDLSKQEKLELSREVEPEYEDVSYNVTTSNLHEYFVDNLDPGNTSAEANVDAAWLGLGTDDATAPAESNDDLNNRQYSEQVTDHADNGAELLASTFLDSTEANGNDFVELGLFTDDPANLANAEVFLINHATFSTVTKDNTKTVTFDVTLTFSDV